MANPFHHPEREATYHRSVFAGDKDAEVEAYLALLTRAANQPEQCGIHEDEIRDVSHGLGLVTRYQVVTYWEAKENGTGR